MKTHGNPIFPRPDGETFMSNEELIAHNLACIARRLEEITSRLHAIEACEAEELIDSLEEPALD